MAEELGLVGVSFGKCHVTLGNLSVVRSVVRGIGMRGVASLKQGRDVDLTSPQGQKTNCRRQKRRFTYCTLYIFSLTS